MCLIPPQLCNAVTIPLWPVGADGRCTCGQAECRRPGKHPARNAPGPGYVIETGQQSGVFVVDVDVKHGPGFDELEALGDLPDTFSVRTGSGGAHFYFRHPGFPVRNRKPSANIDIKGDKEREDGLVYVVGPGSSGWVKTSDPCVVSEGDAYEVVLDEPIADAPAWLLAWLQIGETKKEGHAPTPIDVETDEGQRRVRLGIEACTTMPPSKADGEGGKRLFALAIKLVRKLELPVEVALALVLEHFNPRCTMPDGAPYPWDASDVMHKLEDARDRSDVPCGILSEATVEGLKALGERVTTPPHKRELTLEPAVQGRKVRDPGHQYKYQSGTLATWAGADSANFNDVVQHFCAGEAWAGCWQYDEFADAILCINPPIRLDAETSGLSPDDLSTLREYLEHVGMIVREPDIQKAVRVAAKSRRFHPVQEYLASLPSSDASIFNGLAKRLFGTDAPLADEFLRKFLVSSVRRILRPGCQVDTVLVLHGPQQGEGKTTFVEALFEERWTRRGLPSDLANRDASHALLGYRCVELGELASLLRTEKNAAKDFISWREDVYRQYGNGERVRKPRECVFLGTTNDDDFLRDATGNRRFWVISIPGGHEIPTAWVREHRDQVWAAALALAKDDTFRHWFTRDEEIEVNVTREAFQERDSWHEKIADYCKGKTTVKADEVFTKAIFGELKDFDRRKLLRVTETLRRIGCESKVVAKAKCWLVPDWIRNSAPTETRKVLPMGRN